MKVCLIILCLVHFVLQTNGSFADYGQYRDACIDSLKIDSTDFYKNCDRNDTHYFIPLDNQDCVTVEYCIWKKLELFDNKGNIIPAQLTEYVRHIVDLANLYNDQINQEEDPETTAAVNAKIADDLLTLCKSISGDTEKERIAKLSNCIDDNNFKRFASKN